MSTKRVAQLDERMVFLGMVEIAADAELTALQVDLGHDCDLPSGEYRWNPDLKTFQALPRAQRAVAGRPTLEQATAFFFLGQWAVNNGALPDVTLAWLDDAVMSVDLGGVRGDTIDEYREARGLTKAKE